MFDGRYLDWNQKRIKGIIDHYGHEFMYQKKVLDLGCGYGDVSGALYRLGADVTAVDARQDHLKMAGKKFPGIKTIRADLDRGWPFIGKQFDLILDLDLVCHLSDYEAHIKSVCSSTNHLVLETAVCDSDDPFKTFPISEDRNVYDLSVNGLGCRPSTAAIERVLKECGFVFKRLDKGKFNSGSYVYDWPELNSNNIDVSRRRIWFAIKAEHMRTSQYIPPRPPPERPVVHSFSPENVQSIPFLHPTGIAIPTPGGFPLPTKKIRTALCISGHLRTFESNFQSVKENILDRIDCDVFIHTWDILGLSYRWTDAHLHTAETKNMVDLIYQLYKPKKLVIEKTRPFHVTPAMSMRNNERRDVSGMLSMFYKVEACNQIKKEYEAENNFIYDCVIRFRGDLWVEQPIPIDDRTNLNHLFLPMYGNFTGACDQFAFGSSPIMDKYSSLYSHIEKHLMAGCPMNPERLVKFHIETLNLPVAKVGFKYVIKRANGLIQDNMLMERAWGLVK